MPDILLCHARCPGSVGVWEELWRLDPFYYQFRERILFRIISLRPAPASWRSGLQGSAPLPCSARHQQLAPSGSSEPSCSAVAVANGVVIRRVSLIHHWTCRCRGCQGFFAVNLP